MSFTFSSPRSDEVFGLLSNGKCDIYLIAKIRQVSVLHHLKESALSSNWYRYL